MPLGVRGTDLFEQQEKTVFDHGGNEKKKSTTGTAKKTGAKPRKKEPVITKQDALQIAQAYLADKGGAFGISSISDGIPEGLEPYFAANEQFDAC